MKARSVVLLLITLAASPVPVLGRSEEDAAPPSSGAIRVRVIDVATGAAVEKARVWRWREGRGQTGSEGFGILDTDEEGLVLIDGLTPGGYRMRVERKSFSSWEGARIEVRPGETTEVTVALASAPWTDVEVSLQAAGVPIDGAEVFIVRSAGKPWYHDRQTLESGAGSVVFRDLPFGRYQLHATHPAYPHVPQREIEVTPDASRFELAFAPPNGGWAAVSGRVVDPEGRPVPGAHVNLSPPNASARYETVTDAAGRFALEAVAPGTYWATVAAPGSSPGEEVRLAVEVRPLRAGEIVLALPRTIPISGAVLGLPEGEVVPLQIRARAEDELGTSRWAGGHVGPDGTYHLEGVTSGSWTIEAFSPGAAVRAVLEVPEGADAVAGPDLVFPRLFKVSGAVLYQGRPYRGVRIDLYSRESGLAPSSVAGATTDDRGRFTLGPVSADTYGLTISDPDWGQVHSELLAVAGDLERDLALGAAMAAGDVLDAETGLPVPEASVRLLHLDATFIVSHWAEYRAPLDPEARFEVGPLAEGRWRLRASADGYVPNEIEFEIQGEDLEGLIVPLTPTADGNQMAE